MFTTLLLISSALGGAYIGTVIANATEAPSTVIKSDEVNSFGSSTVSTNDKVKYAILGAAAFLVYKKYLKKGK